MQKYFPNKKKCQDKKAVFSGLSSGSPAQISFPIHAARGTLNADTETRGRMTTGSAQQLGRYALFFPISRDHDNERFRDIICVCRTSVRD